MTINQNLVQLSAVAALPITGGDLSYLVQNGGLKNSAVSEAARVSFAFNTTGVIVANNYPGVVAGGLVDAAPGLQSAIDDAGNEGTVVIAPGQYRLDSTPIISNHHVTLKSWGFATLVRHGTGQILRVTGNNVNLEGLILSTVAGANADHGLYVVGGYGLRLSRVVVAGAQLHGAYLTGNSNTIRVSDCLFDAGNADPGYAAFAHGTGSHNVLHAISRYNGGPATGVLIEDGAGVSLLACDISSTTGGAASDGIVITGAINPTVKDCYFEGIGRDFIRLDDTGGVIANPEIVHNYILADRVNAVAVRVNKSRGGLIDGNTVVGTTGTIGVIVKGDSLAVADLRIGDKNSFGTATKITDPKGRAINANERRVRYGLGTPVDGSKWEKGDLQVTGTPVEGMPVGYVCTTAGYAAKENWAAGHVYAAGDFVRSPSTERLYSTVAGGTAGATEPTHTSGSVSDGGVTWLYCGPAGDLALFSPYGQIGQRSYNGDPNGAVTAYFIGESLRDTSVYPFRIWHAMNTATAWTSA